MLAAVRVRGVDDKRVVNRGKDLAVRQRTVTTGIALVVDADAQVARGTATHRVDIARRRGFGAATAALMSALVPVNTILVSAVPSPVVKVRPVRVLKRDRTFGRGTEVERHLLGGTLKSSLSAIEMPAPALYLSPRVTVGVAGSCWRFIAVGNVDIEGLDGPGIVAIDS
ncbi:MAG: hypothetical protein IPJ48_11535 [Propionivibrio sp.]|uniref:Uncharacterized protein n=1 Tax=Candidatus Propionivibrio dominans TaxID=2954373 RepID=A0A9D7F7P9_9RHOO|nr:hypothetical protein [Candidatus Propionivibrio dominans]